MTAPITVLTPTIPGRESMLEEAVASVKAQTVAPAAMLIDHGVRELHRSPCAVADARNRLLPEVTTEWVATLDDDDWYLPEHFERVEAALADADVVHTYCQAYKCENVSGWTWNQLADTLRQRNVLYSNAAVRTSLVTSLGGWGGELDEKTGRFVASGTWSEDWDFWYRAAVAGARFALVPEVTWHYRIHPEQASRLWADLRGF